MLPLYVLYQYQQFQPAVVDFEGFCNCCKPILLFFNNSHKNQSSAPLLTLPTSSAFMLPRCRWISKMQATLPLSIYPSLCLSYCCLPTMPSPHLLEYYLCWNFLNLSPPICIYISYPIFIYFSYPVGTYLPSPIYVQEKKRKLLSAFRAVTGDPASL